MGKSHFIRIELIICFIMFTERAFSQSPQWIQSNGCQNVTYGETVFDLANNSPATCFNACGNTTESVALRYQECACSPLYHGQLVQPSNKTYTPAYIICGANEHTTCGCLLNNIPYWTNYQITLSGNKLNHQSQPWTRRRCDTGHDERISGSELLSQTLDIYINIWTDIFVEKAHDPIIVSIIYNPSTESAIGSASYSFDTSTEIYKQSTIQQDLSFSHQHVSTSASSEENRSVETTAIVTDLLIGTYISDSFGSQLLDSYTSSSEQSAYSFTEQTRVLSHNNLGTSHQSSISHLQTMLPSYTTISELKLRASHASNININQHVISSTPKLIIEQQTKPPSTRHNSYSERLPFTLSVIQPTSEQGSSTIERSSIWQEQNPEPAALSGDFSDKKPYVIVIMTAVICGMIGVVTALLLINRTLVASQKEMTRMNDILSRKLLEGRRIDTCDELPLPGVVDGNGAGSMRMRRWESRPNEYTFSQHNVNDNESRLSSSVHNSDNVIPNRNRGFPRFSFSTRSNLRSYASNLSSPFRPTQSSD